MLLTEKLLKHLKDNKEKQMLTMYIKNKRECSSIKACSLFEFSCKYESYCFKTAYFSYTQRYPLLRKTNENSRT